MTHAEFHRAETASERTALAQRVRDNRKSPPAADRIAECAACGKAEVFKSYEAALCGVTQWGAPSVPLCEHCATTRGLDHGGMIRARGGWPRSPASRPSLPEAQFYGVQPSDAELPETLPVGTKWKNSVYEGETTEEAKLRRDETDYYAAVRYRQIGGDKWCRVPFGALEYDWIDWSTVPRQATHPPAPSLPSPEPSRTADAKDPYEYARDTSATVWKTTKANAAIREAREAALRVENEPLSRLAASRAKRAAHVEGLGFDVPARVRLDKLGRPVPTGHPRGWPEGSGEE